MLELGIAKVYTVISVRDASRTRPLRLLYSVSHHVRVPKLALVSWGIRLSGLVPGS